MANDTMTSVATLMRDSQKEILADWVDQQLKDPARTQAVPESSLRASSNEFLSIFQEAIQKGNLDNMAAPEWEGARKMLSELSASRALQGSTPSETASFIFSLKEPLFALINKQLGAGNIASSEAIVRYSKVLDQLGLYTFESFQKSREAVIRRQQKDMLEMSTPVIKLWEGVVAVPLIGTLDSARTQIVMENLLQAIVDTNSKVAILDITGVPTVDTQTAQHLIKTVSATRLMGADCIVSGIRPQIAQTIVHLGIDIQDITTKALMSDAIREAMERTGWSVIRNTSQES
ncbi:MAG: STAS domain-containing protein [Cyanobacteria bacterium SZAS-4]|nr:STAS domain-containing protein [Cyanobacteria bacterium SZAS-4]